MLFSAWCTLSLREKILSTFSRAVSLEPGHQDLHTFLGRECSHEVDRVLV